MRDDACEVSRSCIVKQDSVLRLSAKRGYTAALLAAETGIPEPTLRSYMDRPSRPAQMMPWSALVKLMKALPDDLAQLLIEDTEYTIKPRSTREKDWLEIGERATALANKIIRYERTGGRIDHCEDADLSSDLREFAADAQAMAA